MTFGPKVILIKWSSDHARVGVKALVKTHHEIGNDAYVTRPLYYVNSI